MTSEIIWSTRSPYGTGLHTNELRPETLPDEVSSLVCKVCAEPKIRAPKTGCLCTAVTRPNGLPQTMRLLFSSEFVEEDPTGYLTAQGIDFASWVGTDGFGADTVVTSDTYRYFFPANIGRELFIRNYSTYKEATDPASPGACSWITAAGYLGSKYYHSTIQTRGALQTKSDGLTTYSSYVPDLVAAHEVVDGQWLIDWSDLSGYGVLTNTSFPSLFPTWWASVAGVDTRFHTAGDAVSGYPGINDATDTASAAYSYNAASAGRYWGDVWQRTYGVVGIYFILTVSGGVFTLKMWAVHNLTWSHTTVVDPVAGFRTGTTTYGWFFNGVGNNPPIGTPPGEIITGFGDLVYPGTVLSSGGLSVSAQPYGSGVSGGTGGGQTHIATWVSASTACDTEGDISLALTEDYRVDGTGPIYAGPVSLPASVLLGIGTSGL